MITPLSVVELAEIKVHEVDTDSTCIQARPATHPDSHCRCILPGRTQMWGSTSLRAPVRTPPYGPCPTARRRGFPPAWSQKKEKKD
jgi:hypothetical protein